MERGLVLYMEPYDARFPVVCFDERPCVLVGEARAPLAMRPEADMRQDHAYVRGGMCAFLMAFEPLRPTAAGRGWRHARVRPQVRRVEFAEIVRELCEVHYPGAERIRLVCDQLNTHMAADFTSGTPR
jgi:hypothetical protein